MTAVQVNVNEAKSKLLALLARVEAGDDETLNDWYEGPFGKYDVATIEAGR